MIKVYIVLTVLTVSMLGGILYGNATKHFAVGDCIASMRGEDTFVVLEVGKYSYKVRRIEDSYITRILPFDKASAFTQVDCY